MKPVLRSALALGPLTLGLAGCDVAHGAAPLQMNPTPGDEVKLELTTQQEITQSVMDQEQVLSQKMSYGLTQATRELEGGVVELALTYDWILVDMELPAPAPSLTYDSRTSGTPQ